MEDSNVLPISVGIIAAVISAVAFVVVFLMGLIALVTGIIPLDGATAGFIGGVLTLL